MQAVDDYTRALCLVDYDNISPSPKVALTANEHELLLRDLTISVIHQLKTTFKHVQEIDFRLYGGWCDEYGFYSKSAVDVQNILPDLRGRYEGIIARFSLALSLIDLPLSWYKGTLRVRFARKKRQKMVDTLIGVDSIYAAAEPELVVMILTDDDDVVPAVCAAGASRVRAPLVLVRRRKRIGDGLNDSVVSSHNVHLMMC